MTNVSRVISSTSGNTAESCHGSVHEISSGVFAPQRVNDRFALSLLFIMPASTSPKSRQQQRAAQTIQYQKLRDHPPDKLTCYELFTYNN